MQIEHSESSPSVRIISHRLSLFRNGQRSFSASLKYAVSSEYEIPSDSLLMNDEGISGDYFFIIRSGVVVDVDFPAYTAVMSAFVGYATKVGVVIGNYQLHISSVFMA